MSKTQMQNWQRKGSPYIKTLGIGNYCLGIESEFCSSVLYPALHMNDSIFLDL